MVSEGGGNVFFRNFAEKLKHKTHGVAMGSIGILIK